MCRMQEATVAEVTKARIRLSDNRLILCGGLKGIKPGDRVLVYANVAIEKVMESKTDQTSQNNMI